MDTEDPKVIEEKMKEYVSMAKKELDGLLPEKGPFLGGKNIGLAEVTRYPWITCGHVADWGHRPGFDRTFPTAS